MERAGLVKTHCSTAWIDTHEIISVPLAKHVGPVAGDSPARRIRCDPLAPQREVDRDWLDDYLLVDATRAFARDTHQSQAPKAISTPDRVKMGGQSR